MPPTKYQQLARHNSVCNEVFYKLQDCEAEHPLTKFIGKCTVYNSELAKFIKANWQQMIKKNSEKAATKKKKQVQKTAS